MLETAQLTWVNLLDPSTTKNRNPHLRKKIRSHVTRLQHARKQGTVVKRHSQHPPIPGFYQDKAIFPDHEAWQCKDMEVWTQTMVDQMEDDQYCEIFQQSETTAFTSLSSFEGILSIDYNRCPSPRLLLDPSDDLDLHLRYIGANVPETVNYYARVVKCQGRGFETAYSLYPGQGRLILPFLTTDYTLLTALSLLCITSMVPTEQRLVGETGLGLLRLRQYAINSIQKAMQEQGDALTDQLILAVTYFVAYEAIYGSTESYKVHLNGLKDMVLLRGGLAELGLEGVVEAVILYVDANAAGLIGCPPLLKDLPRTRAVHYEVDKELFLRGLSGLEHHDVI